MIHDEKTRNALMSLWLIIQKAQQIASDHRDYPLIKLLDIAARLPYLLDTEEDDTAKFRAYVEAIVREHPDCQFILNVFDSSTPTWTP